MCDCLSFLVVSWRRFWQRVWSQTSRSILPAQHVKVFNAVSSRNACTQLRSLSMEAKPRNKFFKMEVYVPNVPRNGDMIIVKPDFGEVRNVLYNSEKSYHAVKKSVKHSLSTFNRYSWSEASSIASLFTQRGQKGVNQDAVLLIEDFASQAGAVFCGVFDGHGPHGHFVAKNVGDILPQKLAFCWGLLSQGVKRASLSGRAEQVTFDDGCVKKSTQDLHLINSWKDALLEAYKLMDEELLQNDHVDCVSSGTTAVILVKQGHDLILGNVGDSRAVLGSIAEDGSLVAIQLTADTKPDVPSEAERIRRLKGRVFALQTEPSVLRVWLPNQNVPGLAMSRALGDYCLKNHGVISEPEVTHRRLTPKDKFIVLATDGVWNVLSNKEVVEIVALIPVRSSAGKAVVDAAVNAWKSNYSSSKVDDCAVICLFLDNLSSS